MSSSCLSKFGGLLLISALLIAGHDIYNRVYNNQDDEPNDEKDVPDQNEDVTYEPPKKKRKLSQLDESDDENSIEMKDMSELRAPVEPQVERSSLPDKRNDVVFVDANDQLPTGVSESLMYAINHINDNIDNSKP